LIAGDLDPEYDRAINEGLFEDRREKLWVNELDFAFDFALDDFHKEFGIIILAADLVKAG